jgi:hypothetical protein
MGSLPGRGRSAALADQGLGCEPAKATAQVIGCGDDQVPELADGLDPDRPSGALGDQQRAQRLDVAGG